MKKRVSFICAALLSTSALASMSSTTYVDPIIDGKGYAYTDIISKHDWSVSNDTAGTQAVDVCYITIACPRQKNHTRQIRECDHIILNSMETKSGSKMQDLRQLYNWYGECTVTASTEISGWQTQRSAVNGTLRIWR